MNEHFDSLHQRTAAASLAHASAALSQQPLGATVDPAHLRAAEGTTLLHYTLAIRQQQDLGKAFLKYLKSMRSKLTPFTLALALCASTVHRFGDLIVDHLYVGLGYAS